MKRAFPFLLFLAFTSSPALAEEQPSFRALPMNVSGTLSPLLIVIDGKSTYRLNERVLNVYLNGTSLNPGVQKGSPFFSQTTADSLSFSVTMRDGNQIDYRPVVLPSLLKLERDEETLTAEVDSSVQRLLVDGKPVTLESGRASWPITQMNQSAVHSLKLVGAPKTPSRIYNFALSARTFASTAKPREIPWYSYAAIGGVGGVQRTGGNVISGWAGWRPRWPLGAETSLRTALEGSIYKRITGDKFVVLSAQILLDYCSESDFCLGVGAGLEQWFSYKGTLPIATVEAGLPMDSDSLFSRVFASYAPAFANPNPLHTFKLGAEITF